MKKIFNLGNATITIDEKGCISALTSISGESLLHKLHKKSQPLFSLKLRSSTEALSPLSMCKSEQGDTLVFSFENGIELTVAYHENDGYTVFCVEKCECNCDGNCIRELEYLLVGPIFTSLSDVIGDVIGVVQGEGLAIGIQALTASTLPGFPRGSTPPNSEVATTVLSELSVDTLSYYDSAAFPFENGSVLQLFSENRGIERKKRIMGADGIVVPPMVALPDFDGSVVGTSFALFCCADKEALSRIGNIEIGEGLPHPMPDGEWIKTSRKAMAGYLITEFGTENIDKLLDYTKQAGFDSLYHPEPFINWGHFSLRPDFFPEGDASMADCCARARSKGIRLGVHTLSTFTTQNDEYITPIPHKNLAVYGQNPLTLDLTIDATELNVSDSELYKLVTTLQTVRVGNELIIYKKVDGLRLVDCTRGAYGTTAATHKNGDSVQLLCDYPYKVFFPNIALQDEYTARIGELFRNTGLGQISFDGLEGCTYTGEDSYAINRFCTQCWDEWGRSDVINDASRLHHNLWHMNTRMNWGEPWGEAMRQGQISSRMKNQDFYRRNLFPRMLGWFLIRKSNRKFEATSLEDLEWALSKSAGYDAGYALFASEDTLDTIGITSELLAAVKNWERLRLADAFPDEIKMNLQNPKSEWHLEVTDDGDCAAFTLYPLSISDIMTCDLLEMQPGQPGGSDWVYTNPFSDQACSFRMRVQGYGEIINPSISTPLGMIKFSCRIRGGQYLEYKNGKAYKTDRNYRVLDEVEFTGELSVVSGQQHIAFACDFDGEEGPEVNVNFFTYGTQIALHM